MYSIGELAKLVGMTTHGLRYYEKEGLVVPARKGNNRMYSEEDRLWIEFLIHMRATGMPLSDMKIYTELRKSDDPPLEELMALLVKHRQLVEAKIQDFQKNLLLLDKKIEVYREEIASGARNDLFDHFVGMEVNE
ncbi:transcriptional regulator [Listeria floridensis FSL S10-1187]|uniref:Transcriptional regulator n=1 Tax=Listeria floridensis FSL S10-1187 TaxID=1265817 RepID=A0ABP3B1P3_9LIST|nr:MerR family transcriptional regulator [Listeria floridensis]EUJ33861.1 transcriptional regulator [Listeria floridensis FSL S10-1187]